MRTECRPSRTRPSVKSSGSSTLGRTCRPRCDELLSAGFDRAELSFLASANTVEEKLGHAYRKVSDIADDPKTPRSAYVSTEAIGDAQGGLIGGLVYFGALVAAGAVVVSDGSLAAAFAAAAVSGGARGGN